MFDWGHARVFLTVVEAGSFARAARKLGQSQPTVSRRMRAFEAALGVDLFQRTGRELLITDAGIRMLEQARAMEQTATEMAREAAGEGRAVAGLVRVAAEEVMAAYALPGLLAGLQARAPGIEIDLVADDGQRDPARREADIALRHGERMLSRLEVRLLREVHLRFYASREYVAQRGQPERRDFGAHRIVSSIEPDQMLGYLDQAGIRASRAQFAATSNTPLVALQLVRAGLGIMALPEKVGERDPDLVPLFGEEVRFYLPTWLVTHQELYAHRPVRLVFDALEAGLR